jgi:uncharacterized protein (DUF885 family)
LTLPRLAACGIRVLSLVDPEDKELPLTDRRSFLRSAVYTAVAAHLPAVAFSQNKKAEEELTALMDYLYEEEVMANPESRTTYGLDKGKYASAKRELFDRSPAGIEKDHQVMRQAYARLKTIDRNALSAQSKADYDAFDDLLGVIVGA